MKIDLDMKQSLEIQRKMSYHNNLLNARKTASRNANVRAVLQSPNSPPYKALGDATGVSSFDLAILWDEIVKAPNEVMAAELKKVFLLAKLYYPAAMEKINQGREACQLRYDNDLKKIEKAKEDLIRIEHELAACDLDYDFLKVVENWKTAVDHLQEACENAGYQHSKLDYDAWCWAKVINTRSKFMRIGPAPGMLGSDNVMADWSHIRDNLKHEHIRTLIREYNQAVEENIHRYFEVELGRIVRENIEEEMKAEIKDV